MILYCIYLVDSKLTCSIAKVRIKLREEYHASKAGKAPWSTKAFMRTVREIEHHKVVCAGIFADMFKDKIPMDWTHQVMKMLEEAAELYIIDVSTPPHSTAKT